MESHVGSDGAGEATAVAPPDYPLESGSDGHHFDLAGIRAAGYDALSRLYLTTHVSLIDALLNRPAGRDYFEQWVRAWQQRDPNAELGHRQQCGACPIWKYVTEVISSPGGTQPWEIEVGLGSVGFYHPYQTKFGDVYFTDHYMLGWVVLPRWAKQVIMAVDRGSCVSPDEDVDEDGGVTAAELLRVIETELTK